MVVRSAWSETCTTPITVVDHPSTTTYTFYCLSFHTSAGFIPKSTPRFPTSRDLRVLHEQKLCGSLYIEPVFVMVFARAARASTGEKPISISWPVMCGGGEALVRGGRTDPGVGVDGFGGGECED
jgi:hypothetical protein